MSNVGPESIKTITQVGFQHKKCFLGLVSLKRLIKGDFSFLREFNERIDKT